MSVSVEPSSLLWISHRGFTRSATENTRNAFQAALQLGFRAIETDVRATSDEQLVLWHDADLLRLIGSSRPVHRVSREEFERLSFPNGTHPYFLDSLVSEFSACRITLDIKPEDAERTVPLTAAMLQRIGWPECAERFRFLLWRASHERRLRELLPGARCYARKWQCWRAAIFSAARTPHLSGIQAGRTYALRGRAAGMPSLVRRYQARGAQVLAFLPCNGEETNAAIAAGVDEILTDREPGS